MRMLKKVHQGAGSSVLGGEAAKDHSLNSGVHNRASTHGAGLFGDVQLAVAESPVFDHCLGLGECEHLGVRGCVFQRLYLVTGPGNDLPVQDNHRSDRHFLCNPRLPCLAKSFAHEILVAGEIDDGVGVGHRAKIGEWRGPVAEEGLVLNLQLKYF